MWSSKMIKVAYSQKAILLWSHLQKKKKKKEIEDNSILKLGAEYLFHVKSIAAYAPTFLGYNNSVLAIV